MRWRGRRQSGNVEDRRGMPVKGLVGAGGGVVTLIIIVIAIFTGQDPTPLLQQMDPGGSSGSVQVDPRDEPLKNFVSVVLADTEDVWGNLFRRQLGRAYEQPKLVLFTGRVESACGLASAAVGPFYCPGDGKAYLDLDFFREMRERFRAPGDFAMAYVIAHEIGHHVQNLVGINERVQAQRRRSGEAEGNRLSVRMELQADYLAGVWAHHADRTRNILETGDIDEAIRAANAIGGDTLQRRSRGTVVPDSFTHGTSAQRIRWFRRGYQTGDFAAMRQLFELPYEDL
ncbi:MAG: metalloprotease [Phycisphaerae bacterium]